MPIPDGTSSLDIFCRFFTDEVWDLLVTETNRYAHDHPSTKPNARVYDDVDIDEMKAFIGVLILMGILRLPRLEMYWSTSELHKYVSTPGISSILTKTRFEQIFRFLHVANNAEQATPTTTPDKLFKIRALANLLLASFQSNYVPQQTVTVDEAMIPFKGRLSFKQYMKDKPTKWGIKVFVLSDASNGYVYRFQIYAGKSMDQGVEVGLCSRVVLELMEGLEDHGFELYTDNYYTSPQLFLTLYKKGVNCCGTARTNRKGFPKVLVKKKKENRGYYDYRSNGPLLAVAWFDRKYVYFITTMHRAETTEPCTIRRRNQDGSRLDVPCPPLLPDYQQYMRGVDRGDQLVGFYNVGRRSRKWWKRCFSYLLECSLLNAYVLHGLAYPHLHQAKGRKKFDFLQFRLEVATSLINNFCSRQRAANQDGDCLTRRNVALGHWPTKVENKRDCVVCMKNHQTKLTKSRSPPPDKK